MICYVLAMGKQHLGPHVVVGHGIKIFWPGLFITSPDHLVVDHFKVVRLVTCPLNGSEARGDLALTQTLLLLLCKSSCSYANLFAFT